MEPSVAIGSKFASKTSPRKLPPLPIVDKDNRASEKFKTSSSISNVSKLKKGLTSDLDDENSETASCRPSTTTSGSEYNYNGDVEVVTEHNIGKKNIKSRIKEVLSKDGNEVTASEKNRPKRIHQSGSEIQDFAPHVQDEILLGHHQDTDLHLDHKLPAAEPDVINTKNNKTKKISTNKHSNVSTGEHQSNKPTFTDADEQNPNFTPRKLKKRKRNKENDSMTKLSSDFCNKSILETTDMSVLESDISECEYPAQRQSGVGLNLNQEICNISHPVNKLFVEQERGFTAVKKDVIAHSFLPTYSPGNQTASFSSSAAGLAAHSQKLFQRFSVLCHGFLAGVALWQCVIVYQIGPPIFDSSDFITHYASLAKPFQTMFYFLLAICMLSAFDRYDIVCPNWSFLYNSSVLKSGVFAILIYCVTLILSLCISNVDDKLALYVHNNNATSWRTLENMNMESEVIQWRNLNLARCIGVILGWLLLSFQTDKGRLQRDLEEMCVENFRET
ncbi:transmembrane protein 237A-like [Limulus polyphemus]|uniref:Transmembrane protein 237A-like n=1 Tax=Limulus polyphemus TaxID=6850 RepID=A0ABM1C138_LIMPO|nr:transmembrane protein 237A-like [Limulus polyphemus]